MNKFQNLLLISAVFFSVSVSAQVSQGFEGITGQNLQGGCLYTDVDNSSIHVVQNVVDPDCPGLVTVLSPSSGTTLGFQNILDPINSAQPDLLGFSDGDAFGVATNASLMSQLGANAPEGTQGFVMEDIDGDISMEFDNVDLTGTTNPVVSLQYFLSATTYEAEDFLTVTVEISGCGAATTVTMLDADSPAELDAIEGSWNTLSANLSAYVGCTAVLKIGYSSNSSAEELGIDIINFTEGSIGMAPPPAVCPTVGMASTSDSDVCLNETFNLTASGLATMDMASNNEADFGIEFRAHPSTTATPYVGGISLGTVLFGSLTGGTTATLSGASIPYIGNFSVYAILSPAPLDAACRPSAVTTVMVSGCDTPCDPSAGVTATFEEIYPQPLVSCPYVDADNVSIHQIQNITAACGPITVLYAGYGTTLGFENILDPVNTSQAPVEGFSDGDAFGVTDNATLFPEVGANAPEGTQAFLMEDIDADVAMNFDVVDLTGTTSPMFSMQYIVAETTWEAADFVNIHIEITGCGAATSISLLNLSGTALDGVEGSWMTLASDLTPYVGCMAQLVVEFSSSASAEEFAIDNINFTEGCRAGSAPPIVCPMIGTTTISETTVCLNDPFNVSVDGLVNMDMAGNTDQDYGISFVAFSASTATPYVGGIVLGTVPFGSLTAGNTEASFTGASLGMTGTFQVYSILSPSPLDASCRPSSVSSITVEGCNAPCDVSMPIGTSFETNVAQNFAGTCQFVDPVLTMHTLMNTAASCGTITVQSEGYANVLGFENVFTPSSNGTAGFSDGDAFGVATNTAIMSNIGVSASDGVQAFLMEDPDGDVAMSFDEITLTGTTASMFSMDYILSSTSYEGGDFLNIHIEITGCGAATSISLVNLTGAAMGGVAGAWNTLNADLTPYIGCTAQLVVEFSSDAAAEELAIDNIEFSQGCIIFPIVCPTVAAVSASETTVCVNEAFDINATGLATMDAMSNMEQDFGVEFVFFGSATGDPYTGGTSLGTVPFGSLTAGNTTAALVGTSIPFVDPTGFIYAILSPAPFNPTCRPSAVTTIEVQSIPTVDVTLPETYCADAGTVTGGPLVAPTAATTVYSGANVADNGDNSSFEFDVATAGVGVHPVTVTLTNVNGCENIVMVNVTVTALPTVNFTAPADLCLNSGVQNNQGGGTPPQGTAMGDLGIYSGDGVTDDGNGMTYDFDPAAAGVGTHTLTYTYTDDFGCTNSASDDIQVFAIPDATFTAPADLCLNIGVQNDLAGGLPMGGVYSGPGVSDDGNGMTYDFDPATAGVGVHTITYTVGVSGCSDSAMDFVEVFALPVVTLTIPAGEDEYCLDDPTVAINLAGNPTGLGVYSGPGVTDLGNSGISFTFNPAVAGVGTHTVTYTFTDANGCENTATDMIVVNPLPFVTFTAIDDLCLDAGNIDGFGAMPTGGEYSGPGVMDVGDGFAYSFDPAAAGVGSHTITYTYTDANGCTNTASDVVEVFALPVVDFTAPADLCIDASVQTGLGGGTPAPAGTSSLITWTLDNMTFDDGAIATGYYAYDSGSNMVIDWNVSVSGGDEGTFPPLTWDLSNSTSSIFLTGMVLTHTADTRLIRFRGVGGIASCQAIDPIDFSNVSTTNNECYNCSPFRILVSGNLLGSCALSSYSGPGVSDDGNGMTYSFDPAVAGVGTHTITYNYTDENGCQGTASDDIEVFDVPVVNLATPLSYCLDAPLDGVTITGGSPAGGVYSGPGITDLGTGLGYNIDLSVLSAGTITVSYTLTDANGCSSTATSDLDLFDCDFDIVDPCSCLDNATVIDIDAGTGGDDGQFSEIVSIQDATGLPLPLGQTWTVTAATGAFDAFNIPAIGVQSAGVPVATDGSVTLTYNQMGYYEIPFVHVDEIGYSITIEGPFPQGSAANVMLSVSNICSYPNPVFDPELMGVGLCVEDEVVTLGASEPSGVGADAITFTINGMPATEFDPAALGGGDHMVVMTYDGTADGNGGISPDGGTTPAYPGCIQTVTQTINVNPVCCEPPADVTAVSYQICGETDLVDSDMDGMTEDGLPSLEVMNPDAMATYFWFGPSDTPPADPTMGSIATGTTFTPTTRPGVGNTDTYWVVGEAMQDGNICYNNPVAITLTELATPELPTVITEPIVCIDQEILPPLEVECAPVMSGTGMVQWYNLPSGGVLQGTGEMFDPTGTTAEEGVFDANVPGVYTYYAECKATYESECTETFEDRTFDSEAEFSGMETLINFDDIDASAGYTFVGNEYASQGVNISTTGTGMSISDGGASGFCSAFNTQSAPNHLGNFIPTCDNGADTYGPITVAFDEAVNRVGFYLVSLDEDDVQFEVQCMANGTMIATETFITDFSGFQFFGLESVQSFDQIIFTGVGTGNNFFAIDDLRFEGCAQPLMCEGERVPVTITVSQPDAPIVVNEPQICAGDEVGGAGGTPSPYCNASIFHFAGNLDSEAILTVENTGPNSMQLVLSSPNPADPIDDVVIPGGSGAMITGAVTGANEYTVTLTWGGAPPANVNLNVLWSFQNFGGFWQLNTNNFDIPFDGVCDTANTLLEVMCPMALTLEPTEDWFGFMNVFELPENGGGFVFPSGWAPADLVALYNGDELCLQPNQIGDPDPFWYQGGGMPGAPGNKTMEANFYNEDQTGAFVNQTVSFSIEVTSNDFSCDHASSIYIREFNPGFAGILAENFVPISGPGIYNVMMPISATGGPVQYGIQTVGPNVWFTDAAACGSIKAIPLASTVEWYDAAMGGDLQGMGTTLDPTGTTAEEGPFDNNVPGTYTYYAQCVDAMGCISERVAVVFTVFANPESPAPRDYQMCEETDFVDSDMDGMAEDGIPTFEILTPIVDETYNWYGPSDVAPTDPAVGIIAMGETFTPTVRPGVGNTDTYWVTASVMQGDILCYSEPVAFTLTEQATPSAPTAIEEPVICVDSEEVPPLEAICGDPAPFDFTLEPTEGWFGFMNVFELPENGGGFVFPSGWAPADLVALFNGDELCLQPNQIGDPDPFWYQGGGGPGAPGNKTMEANFYNEDQTGAYVGETISFTIDVTSNDFSCGHASSIYIREFNPGFAGILAETFVPIGGPGEYTVSMGISATGGPVQYGIQTVGPNVWVTDAPACGSIKAIPADLEVIPSGDLIQWYDAPVDGDLQGTGNELDPVGTTAEEGAFDISTPGIYTYYAECKATYTPEEPASIEFVPPNDEVGQVWTTNSNDGWNVGRGIVFEAMADVTLSSIGFWHELTGETVSYELAQITVLTGNVTTGQTVIASGSDVFTTTGLEWNDFAIPPVTLTAGNFYHLEFSFPGQGIQNFFYNNGNTPWMQGDFLMLDGTQGGFASNFLTPAIRVMSAGAEGAGCAMTFEDRTFDDPAEFSGDETYINFDDLPAQENLIIGDEYAAQGLTISTTGTMAVTNNGFSSVPYPSLPNGLINFTAATAGGPYEPIIFNFDEVQNRAGFNFYSNTGTTTVTITCSMNGTLVGTETYTTSQVFTYLGIESSTGFDQLEVSVASLNSAFRLDDLSFEGCVPEMLMCESDRTELVYTVVGFDNVTATQACDYTTMDDTQDYDIELCFDVLQGGPSGMFDVFVDDGTAPNMTNIDEYNGVASDGFLYADLGTSIDGTATNCVLLSAADLDAQDLSTVTLTIIDWDVVDMMNTGTAADGCFSVMFDEFLCCAADAGTQSLGPIEVCTDVETSLAPAGTTGTVDVSFFDLPAQPGVGLYSYAWIITDANLDIVNVVGSMNYNIAAPADFSDDVLLNDATGTMLGIGTYCIHGINYLDASVAANAGLQGAVDLGTLETLVGMNAADVAMLVSENDGINTPVGANGTFTYCADLNVATCTPVIINPTPEIVASPEDMYQCAGDDAMFSATAFVLPGDHLDPSPSTLNFVLEWSQDDGVTWAEFVGAIPDVPQPIVGPTGTETVTFTVPGVTVAMNCSLWRVVVTADHNPDPDCFNITETAKLYVHGGGQMSCNDRVNFSADQNCEFTPRVVDFYEGDYDTCGDDEIAYMDAFFHMEFETKAGLPVAEDELMDYIAYDNCLIYKIVDNCTGNSCWGEICLEDKIEPTIDCACPPGAWMTDPACMISCDDVDRYMDGRRGIPDVADNCAEVDALFGGAQIVENECGEYILTQSWSVIAEGYPDQNYPHINCVNEYYVTTPTLEEELECPDDVVYDCTESGGEDLFHPDVTGYPEFGRLELNGASSFCNISAGFDDLVIPACGTDCYGPTKVLRTWTILDWCTLETEVCTQIIKIVDNTPPTVIADDITVSTAPWVCEADVWFEDPQLHDDCDYDLDWEIAWTNSGATLVDEDGMSGPNAGPLKHALGVPKGTWVFAIASVDCCGNQGTTQITVTVLDKAPPVAVATENIVISLTSSGDDWDGTGKIFAESIDNGSHDNCSDVWLEIRREEDPCSIEGNTTYSNKIPESCDPWYDNDDHDYGQFVKFCCADLTDIDETTGVRYGLVKVWMRVWDDGNMDGIHGSVTIYDNPGNDHDYCEIEDNYNEIWVYVRVEEKAPVSLLCPPDVTIPCHWDYTDLSLTGEAVSSGTCDHPEVTYTDWPEIHCGEGYVLREWSAEGSEYVCVQRITIEFTESPLEVVCPTYEDFDGEIWFDPFNPNHVSVDCMDFEFPDPWQSGGKCSLIGVNETIDTFWFEADACFKAIKTWKYVDWCTGEEATCDFVVSLVDTQPPVVMCQDTCFAVDDYWDADDDGIVCEMTSDVNVESMAMDSGDCGSEWIKWVAEVDLWYDGTVDLTYSSFFAHNDPFYVAPTMTGSSVSIRLDKDDISAEWARHVIEWKAFDGCGNVAQCHQYVEVADKKAPTPYCVGISTALMSPEAGNLVELWAKDFNLGSYDNCTADHWLRYTFNEVPPVLSDEDGMSLIDEDHCFQPVWFNEELCVPLRDSITGYIVSEEVNNCNGYENGAQDPDCQWNAVQKWNPNGLDEDGNPCKTAGMKYKGIQWCGENDVKISVWDKKMNMDYCSVNLVIHGTACPDAGVPTSRIAGTISTETGSTVTEVMVTNTGDQLTGGLMQMMTSTDGAYAFESIIDGGAYAITANRDNDHLNGVSTLDLVLIQKHVLGLQAFDSAYKMVAADVNNDQNVSAVDLVELRKLILGIYTEFPDNESWRFIDSDQSLDINSPWPLTEEANINNLQTDMMSEDFVGVKVGDVNGNVIANATDIDIEERSGAKLAFVLETQTDGSIAVKAGENFTEVYGYQFTMEVQGNVADVISGALEMKSENFGILGNQIVTTSYTNELGVDVAEGKTLFTLKGVSGISLVNGITKAEAYQGKGLKLIDVELRNQTVDIVYGLGQNEPNPFSEETVIEFTLGKAGSASLSIYDVTGKLVKVIEGVYEQGNHQIKLNKDDLDTSGGILHYKLESGDYVNTKRMIYIR